MNADKPGTQEHEQSAFKDKIALNDGTIPSGNSMLSSCLSSTNPPNFFFAYLNLLIFLITTAKKLSL